MKSNPPKQGKLNTSVAGPDSFTASGPPDRLVDGSPPCAASVAVLTPNPFQGQGPCHVAATAEGEFFP